jgi:hypothetical protein
MASSLPGMSLVAIQMLWVGLDYATIIQEQQACFFCGHAGDEGFGLVEQFSQADHGGGRIDGRVAGNTVEIFLCVASGSANLVDDSFRCEPNGLADSGPNGSAQRENPLMNCQQINNVARLPSSVSRSYFVGGKINGVKHIAKGIIGDGGEEAVITIGYPFQFCSFT